MPTGDLKGEFVNRAYSFMRISGITKQPSPEEIELAVQTLEDMASEWEASNICTGYNFEDEPDANSKHGVERKYWLAYQLSLASILLIDKGKSLTAELSRKQSGSYSNMVTLTAANNIQRVYPSNSMPVGSGNERVSHRLSRFYNLPEQPEPGCDENRMVISSIDDFAEKFNAYLTDSESIDSFEIEADSGLTIVSSSIDDTNINYRVEATGGSSNETTGTQYVKITMTTDAGRVETRLITFYLVEVELE